MKNEWERIGLGGGCGCLGNVMLVIVDGLELGPRDLAVAGFHPHKDLQYLITIVPHSRGPYTLHTHLSLSLSLFFIINKKNIPFTLYILLSYSFT